MSERISDDQLERMWVATRLTAPRLACALAELMERRAAVPAELRERIANENALAWYGWPLGEPLDERQTAACYAHADSILALIAERPAAVVMPEEPTREEWAAICGAITKGKRNTETDLYWLIRDALAALKAAGR